RYTEDSEVVVFINFSERRLNVNWKNEFVQGYYRNLFSGERVFVSCEEGVQLDEFGYWIGIKECSA
ncbi:MAG TPA: hypothetical protein VIK74_08225, partial [Parasegetibacter sp.]